MLNESGVVDGKELTRTDLDMIFAKAKEANKPLLVFITEEWCGACKNLKREMNAGSSVKDKLANFVVTHVSGEAAAAWKEDG